MRTGARVGGVRVFGVDRIGSFWDWWLRYEVWEVGPKESGAYDITLQDHTATPGLIGQLF